MGAIGTTTPVTFSLRDATSEVGRNTVYAALVTAANIDDVAGLITDYKTALDAITLGVIASTAENTQTVISNASPTNPAAQREAKLLVTYQDDVTEKRYTTTVPTIDFAQLVFLPEAGDAVAFKSANGASAAMIAFVTAFEALAMSPDDPAHSTTVVGMRFVGRNN